VEPVSDIERRFEGLETILVRAGGDTRELAVESVRPKGKLLLLKLGGVDDRTAAQALRGAELGVSGGSVSPVPEGQYYVHDMVGCKVIGKSGRLVGEVRDVVRMPASDVFVVDGPGGEVLIPFVDAFVRRIDLENKRVEIDEIEGLVD